MSRSNRLCCPECDFSSSREKRLVKHVKKSHGKTAVKCPWCTTSVHYSSSSADVSVHKKRQHRSIRLRCFLCEFSSRSLTKWSSHLTRIHGRQIRPVLNLVRYGNDHNDGLRGVDNQDLRGSDHNSLSGVNNQYLRGSDHKNGLRRSVNNQDRRGSDCSGETRTPYNQDLHMKPNGTQSNHRKETMTHNGTRTKELQEQTEILPCSTTGASGVAGHRHDVTTEVGQGGPGPSVAEHSVTPVTGQHCCAICGLRFDSGSLLNDHIRARHECDSLKYNDGNNNWTSQMGLKRNASSLDKYRCLLCNVSFVNKYCLDSHKKFDHPDIPKYNCPGCNKVYSTRAGMRIHYKAKHTDCAKHVCKLCGYSAGTPKALKWHVRIHSEERPFLCHLCPYTAKTKHNLDMHMKSHTLEKPFKCHICPYMCSVAFLLRVHIRTHTNERPYKCPMCESAFKKSDHLTNHIRVHTGERPYKCESCGFSFAKSSNLRAHKKSVICVYPEKVGAVGAGIRLLIPGL